MPPPSQQVPGRTKRTRTRAALVEAAAELIAEQGYERTTLEQVAARADMTRGAIYGNYKNKDELFLAVVATKWQPVLPPMQPGASFAHNMDALADAVVAAMPARRRAAIGAASFQLYALKNTLMRARIARANEDIYRQMAAGLRSLGAEADLAVSPELFVKIAHALIEGLMLLHALTPELFDSATIRAAIGAFTKKTES